MRKEVRCTQGNLDKEWRMAYDNKDWEQCELHPLYATRIIYEREELLIKARNDLGLSLREAAKLIGCTKPHLHDIEKGTSRNPSAKILNGFVSTYKLTHKQVLDIYI